MDELLKLQHEVDTCAALACAAGAMLCEAIDKGSTDITDLAHTRRVIGLLQDRLEQASALATRAAQNKMQG